jgi:CVNH domain
VAAKKLRNGETIMRYATTFGMVALTMALFGSGTTCHAQRVPSGSYQQTCQNIGVRGSTLYASCKDVRGQWQSTELADFQRCGSEIQNENGNLTCNNSGGGNNGYARDGRDRDGDRNRDGQHENGQYGRNGYGPNGAPNGSYVQTCQNVNMNGNTLQASCQKKNGKLKNTSLNNVNQCNGDIANDNGKLRCR